MTDFSRNALVVEGGGMRGAFTSGVLDVFYNNSSTHSIYMLVYRLVQPCRQLPSRPARPHFNILY